VAWPGYNACAQARKQAKKVGDALSEAMASTQRRTASTRRRTSSNGSIAATAQRLPKPALAGGAAAAGLARAPRSAPSCAAIGGRG
jgi:hypothetical protein